MRRFGARHGALDQHRNRPKKRGNLREGPPDEPPAETAKTPEPALPAPRRAPLPAPPLASSAPRTPTPKTLDSEDGADEAPPSSKRRELQWSAGLGALAGFGVAPEPALALLGFASARRGVWSLALAARASLPATTERSGVSFRTSSEALDLAPCAHLGVAFVCEVTALGWLSASGTQSSAQSGTSLSFSLGGRLGAELPLSSSVGLVAHGEMLVNPWPARVVAPGQSSTPLWRASPLSGDFALALAVHF